SDSGWRFSTTALVEDGVFYRAHTEQSTWRPVAKGPGGDGVGHSLWTTWGIPGGVGDTWGFRRKEVSSTARLSRAPLGNFASRSARTLSPHFRPPAIAVLVVEINAIKGLLEE